MKKKVPLIAFLLFLLVEGNLPAESAGKAAEKLGKDLIRVFSSPAKLSKKDILPAALFSAGTACLMLADEGIRNFAQNELRANNLGGGLFSAAELFGNGYYVVPAICGVYLAGLGFKDKGLEDTAFLCADSFLVTAALTTVLKTIVGRERPFTGNSAFSYAPLSVDFNHRSFPSGHTSTAFCLAAVLAGKYGGATGAAAYAIAACTGLSRIYYNWHWASDVFTGAVLGILAGRAVVSLNAEKSRVVLLPYYDPGKGIAGVRAGYYFNN